MDLPLPAPSRDPVADRAAERARLLRGLVVSAALTALLWWIAWFQHAWGWDFSGLTLRPGSARGLIGILSAPLLHGSLAHLVANTLPLLLLGTLAVATLPRASLRALPWIWLLSGFGTWLIGRESAHLGASGLTHGLMFFVLTAGIVRRDRAAIAARRRSAGARPTATRATTMAWFFERAGSRHPRRPARSRHTPYRA